MYYMSSIGQIIEGWMHDRGIRSQGELARRANVTQPTVNRIISGESKDPRRSNLDKICRVLGRDTEELYMLARGKRKRDGGKAKANQIDSIMEQYQTLSPKERRVLLRQLLDLDEQ